MIVLLRTDELKQKSEYPTLKFPSLKTEYLSLFKNIYLFIYLAVQGLSCGMRDL